MTGKVIPTAAIVIPVKKPTMKGRKEITKYLGTPAALKKRGKRSINPVVPNISLKIIIPKTIRTIPYSSFSTKCRILLIGIRLLIIVKAIAPRRAYKTLSLKTRTSTITRIIGDRLKRKWRIARPLPKRTSPECSGLHFNFPIPKIIPMIIALTVKMLLLAMTL